MHRPRAAITFAAILMALALTPVVDREPASAAGECGTYQSETEPPPQVRVFRTATGAVDAVDFRTYVKNVLSREWISSWTTESLRAGAMAVKNYAWYQVLHWRGYVNAAGQCFDVFDSTADQHYDPSRPTYPSMAAAVDATWSTLAHRAGHVFATYYNAGSSADPCGANANGWQMLQWGTQACGLAGHSAAAILGIYYAGVTVVAAPAPEPPAAIPTPSPSPTEPPATPAPIPPPSSSAPPPSSAPPAPPPPSPTAAPAPAAQAPEVPGGGQVGLIAPPPPPPPNPEPVVVGVQAAGTSFTRADLGTSTPRGPTRNGDMRRMSNHAVVRFEAAVDAAVRRAADAERSSEPRFATRLLVVQLVLDRAVASVPLKAGG